MDVEHIDYSKETVLVVDDEESVRGPVVEMLNFLGFTANSAINGKDALIKLEEKPHTFLLTDIKMPKMDGLKLIGLMKDDYPYICTIAMTGYSQRYKYIDVINAGASDFINKPFLIEELEAKIRRAIIERDIRQELSRLSITDSLTGLFNQGHFYARLKDEIMRAERQKNELALILLDLDDFKNYNDTHGHVAGDVVLKKVGEIVNASIRYGVDSGYRYGGDEFAVILIDADMDIALSIGKRIANGIEKESNLTASTGYAYFSEGMTPESFVDVADKHLYRFKGQRKIQEDNMIRKAR